jgi:hypothetical protein
MLSWLWKINPYWQCYKFLDAEKKGNTTVQVRSSQSSGPPSPWRKADQTNQAAKNKKNVPTRL